MDLIPLKQQVSTLQCKHFKPHLVGMHSEIDRKETLVFAFICLRVFGSRPYQFTGVKSTTGSSRGKFSLNFCVMGEQPVAETLISKL